MSVNKSKLTSSVFLILASLILSTSTTFALELKPISISYEISFISDKYGNATLGKLITTLSNDKQMYSVVSSTKAQGLAAILLGNDIQESCSFTVENERIISHSYAGSRNQPSDFKVSYDWNNRKINFSDGDSLDMPQGYVIDTCSLPFAAAFLKNQGLSSEIVYVVDGEKKRIRGYRLKSTSKELLSTKLGKRDTLKLVLERDHDPSRTFTLWLSPNHSYVPLKMVENRNRRTFTFMVNQISKP